MHLLADMDAKGRDVNDKEMQEARITAALDQFDAALDTYIVALVNDAAAHNIKRMSALLGGKMIIDRHVELALARALKRMVREEMQ